MAQIHSFSFLRLKTDDLVVDFLIENNSVHIVKQTEQMSLMDGETDRERESGFKYDFINNKQKVKQQRQESRRVERREGRGGERPG